MKILFISEQLPYPLDTGGNIRTFHVLKALSSQHRVTLLAASETPIAQPEIEPIRRLGVEVRVARVARRSALHHARSLMLALSGRLPFLMARHFRTEMCQAIRAAFKGTSEGHAPRAHADSYDVVHFSHLDAAIYMPDVPKGVLRVLDEHNVVTNQVRTTLKHETRHWRRFILRRDLPQLRRFETATCNAMDMTIACSTTDAKALRAMGANCSLKVMPNGVDLGYFQPRSARPRSSELVFVGTMDYDPCEKAVYYFCSKILPLIRREIGFVRFVVVGRNPSRRLRAMAEDDLDVVLTGRVPDVRPFVQRADVFVVPLLSGSGTRLKILEAMAMGVPIVTTSIGVEGIRAVNGEHLLIVDSPATFARGVVQIMRDPALARKLATNARTVVEREYAWPALSDRLLEEYPSKASSVLPPRTVLSHSGLTGEAA